MAKVTRKQYEMMIDFEAYLDICTEEASSLSDDEIFNKFSSRSSYEEMIEATGIPKEEYPYSEYLEVFNQVKLSLNKSLANFRTWLNKQKKSA